MPKIANMLDKLPKRLHPRAEAMTNEIMRAPDLHSAEDDLGRFIEELIALYPKGVERLVKNLDTLPISFDFPAEHWIHLRTTSPIESPFATVKTRTRQTKGAGSRKAGLALAVKLALASQEHWRRVNAPHLVALVRAGVEFGDGKQVAPYPERELLMEEDEALRIAD